MLTLAKQPVLTQFTKVDLLWLEYSLLYKDSRKYQARSIDLEDDN